ncbi:MAG: hypothetical protein QM777_18650 [Pseudorhodoferax sp.]
MGRQRAQQREVVAAVRSTGSAALQVQAQHAFQCARLSGTALCSVAP